MSAGTYAVHGLSVSSEIPLPELTPASGSARPPDVTISLAELPARVGGRRNADGYWVGGDGVRLEVDGVARFLIRGGEEILIEPAAAGEPGEDVRLFLLGSALGALLHQRGLLPIHASVVRVGTVAVAFSADTGGGKSTLAACLMRRGYPVVCDDVGALSPGAKGLLVQPGVPRIRLTPEASGALGVGGGREAPRPGADRKRVFVDRRIGAGGALPLARIYFLDFAEDVPEPARVESIGAFDALVELRRSVYRPSLVASLGREGEFLEWARGALAAVEAFRLSRRRELGGLDETTSFLENHLDGLSLTDG